MLFPFFIALAIASSELWGRRIVYLIQKADDILFSNKQDCISGLPDDILFSILSRLSFKEVVKTSILSRRWRYLYASMPNLDFSSLTMFSVPEGDHVCSRYLHRFVNGVNQFVQLYSGPKIFSFRFAFCLGGEFAADIERWIWFAIRMGVEELDINFTCEYRDFKYNFYIQRHIFSNLCAFSYQLLSEASKLKRLHLNGCIVMPNFNVKLNSLKILHLDYVPLAGREVEDILSCCSNLEQLVLRACLLPAKLCIHGPSSLRLKSLSLLYCLGSETIDLCAINLTVFECFDFGSVEFSFSSVPKLESVFLHVAHTAGMSYIFSELPKDLPQLKTLLVRTGAVKLSFIPARITMFTSLRQLELILTNCSVVYHQKIPPILGACPLLRKFCLVIGGWPGYRNGTGTEETPLCHHTQLQEVEFTGFDGTENELNLALYFLRSAVALKRMFISRNYRLYRGLGNCENYSFDAFSIRSFFCTRLQGKAVSRSAEVIVI